MRSMSHRGRITVPPVHRWSGAWAPAQTAENVYRSHGIILDAPSVASNVDNRAGRAGPSAVTDPSRSVSPPRGSESLPAGLLTRLMAGIHCCLGRTMTDAAPGSAAGGAAVASPPARISDMACARPASRLDDPRRRRADAPSVRRADAPRFHDAAWWQPCSIALDSSVPQLKGLIRRAQL